MLVVKKYSNRRLYDTAESRYVTLDELADKIRAGADARVIDAKTGADLTQATLTQIILESRGGAHLLPVGLLTRLIRLQDDALAEFLGRYVGWSLEVYLQAKSGAQALAPYNPFATVPFSAGNALARLLLGGTNWLEGPGPAGAGTPAPPPVAPAPPPAAEGTGEISQLRRELDELRQALKGRRKKR